MLPAFSFTPGLKTLHLHLTLAHTETRQPSKRHRSAALVPLCTKAFMEDSKQGRLGFPVRHFT